MPFYKKGQSGFFFYINTDRFQPLSYETLCWVIKFCYNKERVLFCQPW
ncbi:hypothetical protein FTV88_2532 [Heliorestis convoluta]|uniref:Uncharacterized protein n=1 Tax=Heliorestis convoluta TaxID=356322 RepID=A0A5Q2N807_9FIRM|nr:hypothetical protein FTV88_2532 [Heliorestis convoluta]